jgi:hypothetical protein
MALELYMVGVIVADMARSLEFYQRLGVEFPNGSEGKQHVEVKMGNMTFFLNDRRLNARWDPAKVEPAGGYRIILEFYLKTLAAVEAKYAEMIGYGYESHVAPFRVSAKLYFAMVNDPDGNTILLSGESEDEAAVDSP